MVKQGITYSRHARSRMRLYFISQEDVEQAIANPDQGPVSEGNRYVVYRKHGEKFKGMPLKVIYVLEDSRIIVVSAYPLKKSYRR